MEAVFVHRTLDDLVKVDSDRIGIVDYQPPLFHRINCYVAQVDVLEGVTGHDVLITPVKFGLQIAIFIVGFVEQFPHFILVILCPLTV